ncbi:HesA/MoeB/ThiF family protein [Candidatus Bathyarchaeota archaeon]|nr:HesA/MoeB/ThiF family protein [Candidatus Bathyarchaeota archaeon]
MSLDEVDREQFASQFYSRQLLIEQLGAAGQEKLSGARVAVVGVGGLGSVCSLYLALAGVGYLRLIDPDTVAIHNLHRQILYSADEVGHPKAELAAKLLRKKNPLIKVNAVIEKVDALNVETLLEDVDVVVDCLDNFQTRYLVNRACIKLGVPYVFAAVTGLEGNLAIFNPPDTGCLECTMHSQKENSPKRVFGIIGAAAGIMGSLEALETIKLIADVGSNLSGKMLVCDFTDMSFMTVPLPKNPNCSVCGSR